MTSEPSDDQRKHAIKSRPVCLVLVALVGLSFAVFGEKGALRLHQVRQHQAQLMEQVQQLNVSNLLLRNEVAALQNDDRYLEQVARGQLSFVRDGELVYQFLPRSR